MIDLLLPSWPNTPARRLSLVAGLLLIALGYLCSVGAGLWEGRHFEWAIERAIDDPPKLAVLMWWTGALLIAASAWWRITLGAAAAASVRVARWVRGS